MKLKIFLLVVLSLLSAYSQDVDFKYVGPYNGLVDIDRIQVHPLYTNRIITCEYSGGIFYSEDDIIKNLIDLKASELPFVHYYPDNPNKFFAQSGKFLFNVDLIKNEISLIHENSVPLFIVKSHFVFNPIQPNVIFNSRDGTKLFRSDDGGNEWRIIKEFNQNIEALAIAPSDTSVLYCGIDGKIYRSTDSGINWMRMTQENGFGLRKIIVNPYNKSTIYLIYKNNLYVSYDAGITIQPLLVINGVNTFVLNPIDTLKIYAVQGDLVFQPNGSVFKTTDGGINWSIINNNLPGISVTPMTIAIDPVYPETLYVSNGSLGVFKSTNGGDSWEQTKIVGSRVFSLYNYPARPDDFLAGTAGWGMLRTSDGGMNWYQPDIAGYYQAFVVRNISANPFNKDEFLVGSRYSVIRSTDRGNSWFDTGQLEGARVIQYHPTIENLVLATTLYPYAPSNDDTLWRSTDNGFCWEKIRVGLIEGYHFDPTDENIIYGISQHMGRVLKSTNAGLSWEDKTNNLPNLGVENGQCLAIDPFDPEIIYVGLRPQINDPGGLFKSTNGGESWIRIDSTLSQLDQWLRITSILTDKSKPGRIYISMSQYSQPYTPGYASGGLFLTEDYGINWRRVYDGAVFSLYEDDKQPRNIFVNTKFGLLKFLDTLTVITSVDFSNNEVLNRYFLFQNYPNPFNPSTNIQFNVSSRQFVTLKIYDILGREISTLVNEYKEAGTHSIQFNAEGLPGGVYFYRLISDYYSETKKMILLR